MPYPVKADFHLHTYHSDNRDRMTPAEYVALAQEHGFSVLGFCDHHHNLTQSAWDDLRDEVAAHASSNLLLTTGYEATWMDGHLCVLDKEDFDGESIADAMHQTWSMQNTRILAHPDNNICAWNLPLPLGIQAVEVINGGQDPYSVRATSPCNGLATYRRYLSLNQRVAAVAQSDCHERAIFGRVWTHLFLPDDASLTWENVRAALHRGNTCAVMGDLPVRFWAVDGTLMGEEINDPACRTLRWRVPQGSTVTVSVADRPVAFFPPTASGEGEYMIQGNGPHWIQVQRGLAWAVSSPIWVANQQVDVAPIQARLSRHRMIHFASAALRQNLEWIRQMEANWAHSPMPIAAYMEWMISLLPQNWQPHDVGFSGHGDPADWALGRIHAAYELSRTLLAEVCRVRAQAERPPATQSHAGEHRLYIAAPTSSIPTGVYLQEVDLPRDWEGVQVELVDDWGTAGGKASPSESGKNMSEFVPCYAVAVPGMRDPLGGPRSRTQMDELIVWLTRGEIHEYFLTKVEMTVEDDLLSIVADLEPARLGGTPTPRPEQAATLRRWLESPEIARFHVHLRMPRRFALAVHLGTGVPAATAHLRLTQSAVNSQSKAEEARALFLTDEALRNNTMAGAVTVQVA